MKKTIIAILVALMLVLTAGCTKKDNNPTPKPTPTPTPTPTPAVTKLVTKLGNEAGIENVLEKFNSSHEDWSAFRLGKADSQGFVEYTVWDDDDIYSGNYEQYVSHGVMPVVYLMVKYAEDSTIDTLYAWLPYEDIEEVDEDQAEGIVDFQKLLLSRAFPDLSDKDIDKVIDKLALTLEDGFEAYRRGQADPTEFEGTSVDIYPSEDGQPYNVTCGYDDEYETLELTISVKQ